jgi:hypothetical protein
MDHGFTWCKTAQLLARVHVLSTRSIDHATCLLFTDLIYANLGEDPSTTPVRPTPATDMIGGRVRRGAANRYIIDHALVSRRLPLAATPPSPRGWSGLDIVYRLLGDDEHTTRSPGYSMPARRIHEIGNYPNSWSFWNEFSTHHCWDQTVKYKSTVHCESTFYDFHIFYLCKEIISFMTMIMILHRCVFFVTCVGHRQLLFILFSF